MGYTLMIGEQVNGDEVQAKTLDDAPADGSPTDHTNARWPSYSCWADFVSAAGLGAELDQLMPSHPGIARVTPEVVASIESKLAKKKLPAEHRGRAAWLRYWLKWSPENCKRPAFYNS